MFIFQALLHCFPELGLLISMFSLSYLEKIHIPDKFEENVLKYKILTSLVHMP